MGRSLAALRRRAVLRGGDLLTRTLRTSTRRRHDLEPPTQREVMLASIPRPVLEIGPFDCPALAGPGVRYFDVLDRAGLRARARELERNPDTCPDIDYVSPTGDLAVVDQRFAAVVSSHVVEHQPDLVSHLQGVERLLEPDGTYHLIVPDKRFCFDHFRASSTLGEVIEAHAERRRVHTPENVRRHVYDLTHNDPLDHWLGRHGRVGGLVHMNDRQAAEFLARADTGEYVDVHAWSFTPASFRKITAALHDRALTRLRPRAVHDTRFGDLEFCAVLEMAR